MRVLYFISKILIQFVGMNILINQFLFYLKKTLMNIKKFLILYCFLLLFFLTNLSTSGVTKVTIEMIKRFFSVVK